MLVIMKAIENIVDKYADDYRFINDHELNVVCQIDTDEERMEIILAEIDEKLPAGIIFSHEYIADEYEITFYEGGNAMRKIYERRADVLDALIQNEFGILDYFEPDLSDDGTYTITLIGPHIQKGETCMSAGFRGREDGFFAKMRRVKDYIKILGYNAELIKYEADRDHLYSEVKINIKLDGSEL